MNKVGIIGGMGPHAGAGSGSGSGSGSGYLQCFLEECLEPDVRELQTIMTGISGIYGGVKAGDLGPGRSCFTEALASMARRTGVAAFLMACAAIPQALDSTAVKPRRRFSPRPAR